MKKYLFLLIIPILSLGLISCNNEEDVKPMDLRLLDGVWEVVDQGNQDVFDRKCLLNISTSHDLTNEAYGALHGYITTFYLTATDIPKHDKEYSWSICEIENHLPLLDLTFQADIDSDDIEKGEYSYTITKLTDTHLWWQIRSDSDNSTIKFRRRTDIKD